MKKKLFVDKNVCIDCRYCEAVCSLVHDPDHRVNPRRARIVIRKDFDNAIFTPVVCRQCTKPACVEACGFDAMAIDPTLDTPTIDPEKCTNCMDCLEACPFDAIFSDSEQGIAIMCDLCGGDPQCVKFCRPLPHVGYAALTYTTPEEWSKLKARLILAKK